MANVPLAGRRITKVTERKTREDWALFWQDIALQYENVKRITWVMDNLNTHMPGTPYTGRLPARAGQGCVGSV